MKRCPACKRVENDNKLVYCRADGTPLVSDSGSFSAEAGTEKFGSSPVASEVETSILSQHATDAGMSRATGPTTVLDNAATFYAALGEKDKALAELNKAYENREPSLRSLKVDPLLDPLRDDPRFADLMRRMGMPQ